MGLNKNSVKHKLNFASIGIDTKVRKSIATESVYQILATLSSNIPLLNGNCRNSTCKSEDRHVSPSAAKAQKGHHKQAKVTITVEAIANK
jgi:hypothetical protein